MAEYVRSNKLVPSEYQNLSVCSDMRFESRTHDAKLCAPVMQLQHRTEIA